MEKVSAKNILLGPTSLELRMGRRQYWTRVGAWVLTCAMASGGVKALYEWSTTQAAEWRVNQMAQDMFDDPDLEVQCGHTDSAKAGRVGFVRLDDYGVPEDDTIHLRTSSCKSIASPDNQPPDSLTKDGVAGLYFLSHEQAHTQGVTNEAAANCYAIQRLPMQMQKAGYNPDIIQQSWPIDHILNIINLQSEKYRSLECRKDGEYDLDLGNQVGDEWLSQAGVAFKP